MKTRFVKGTYGSGKTPCFVYVAEMRDGSRWYAVEDSVNVNCTHDEIEDGVNVEELSDFDFFTASKPIDSEEELERQVEL